MPSSDTALAAATHCLLAYRVRGGPAMTPMACWSDGGGVWMTTSRRAAKVAALRRDPRCAVWIEPSDPAEPGVVVDGHARVYDASDPVGLLLHGPAVSAAAAALALHHRASLAGYVRDLARLPAEWMPQHRVLLRVRIDRARSRLAPQQVAGVGPVLPTEVPAGVRRALGGTRRITVATLRGDALAVQPAVWRAGFALDLGATAVPEHDTPACVVADARPSTRAGVLLRGTLDATLRLRPTRLVWWEGFASGSAPVRDASTTSGITLPD